MSKICLAAIASLVCAFCPSPSRLGAQTGTGFALQETVVNPLPSEDIAAPCHYTLNLAQTRGTVSIVWVIFDRGRDVHDLASDSDVLAFARRFNVAILLQSHCPGKLLSDKGDMNMQPTEGLGPALQRALDQFARQSAHPELVKANLMFLGFSGAGPLSARLVQEFSSRTLAAVLTAPGHYDPQGIDTVVLDRQAQQVPELIVANGADERTGTRRPYDYFVKYRDLGAPWTFVLQNHSPHCCTANAKTLMLSWLLAVLSARVPPPPNGQLREVSQARAMLGTFDSVPTDIKDEFGFWTFNAVNARVLAPTSGDRPEGQVASWIPNAEVAKGWLSFIQQESHPVLPLN